MTRSSEPGDMNRALVKRPQFFFTTAPLPCPYVEGRMERKIVTELNGPSAEDLHESLSRAGFRRSHAIAYMPACPGCQSCVPVRVIVNDFRRQGTLKRIWKANQDLTVSIAPPHATAEQYRLFARYQDSRHSGSDMALMGFYDYRSMIEDSPIPTHIVEFRDSLGALHAACLTDRVTDGLSAVYSFFEPDLPRRSLGAYIVLWLLEQAATMNLPYVYLGYWIKESRKMAYKTRFAPLEAFGPGGWSRLDLSNPDRSLKLE